MPGAVQGSCPAEASLTLTLGALLLGRGGEGTGTYASVLSVKGLGFKESPVSLALQGNSPSGPDACLRLPISSIHCEHHSVVFMVSHLLDILHRQLCLRFGVALP